MAVEELLAVVHLVQLVFRAVECGKVELAEAGNTEAVLVGHAIGGVLEWDAGDGEGADVANIKSAMVETAAKNEAPAATEEGEAPVKP